MGVRARRGGVGAECTTGGFCMGSENHEKPVLPARWTRRAFLDLTIAGAGVTLLAACQQAAPAAQPTTAPAAKPTEVPKPATPAAAPAAAAATTAPTASAAPKVAASGDVEASILEAAKREGKVTLYSSFNLDEFDKIQPVFEKRYPDIKMDQVRANGEDLVQRMVTETKGGKILSDVLETNSFDVFNAISQNLLEPWKAPNAGGIPDDLKDASGMWTCTRMNVDCIAWNTNLVSAADAPRGYDDLADPKWKGKMMIESEDMEMFAGLVSMKFGNDLEKATAWLKKVAANEPEAHKGHTETTELLAAGQAPIFFGAYAHRIESLKKKKAPLDWTKTEAVQLLQVGGVVKGAAHPNAARVFFNWMIGEEGQQAISNVGRVPSRPGVKLEAPLKPDGIKFYATRPEMARQYAQLAKVWTETFGLR